MAKLRVPEVFLQGYSSGKCDMKHSWDESWAGTNPEPPDGLDVDPRLQGLDVPIDPSGGEASSAPVVPLDTLQEMATDFQEESNEAPNPFENQDLSLQDPIQAMASDREADVGEPAAVQLHSPGPPVVDEADRLEREEELQDDLKDQGEEHTDMKPPTVVRMIFAVPLLDSNAATIKEGLQDILLYLRSHNIPVLRFHSDQGSEFMARDTRRLMKDWGLRVTTGEGGVPKANGAAEQAVKWIKQRTRTLLYSAEFPF